DVNVTNDRGETALHGATYRGADSIVTFLIDKGAKLDVRNEVGWTPWTIANGVFYGNFFHRQLATLKILEKAMGDRGISTQGMAADSRQCFDCDAAADYAFMAKREKGAGATPAAPK